MLLYPLKYICVTCDNGQYEGEIYYYEAKHDVRLDIDDHGYNAFDYAWTDDDGSGDMGRNCYLRAMADGVVTQIVNSHPDEPDWNGYGNYIVISYPSEGYCSLYAHIKKNSFLVKVGDKVTQRQKVCRMGNSGYSLGNHLHMEVCKGTTFTRHGGIDYTPIVYADEWNIVKGYTQDIYNIRHMVLMPVDKDVTKKQIEVLCKDLNVRTEPSASSKSMGFAQQGYYDVEDVYLEEETNITWAKVDKYYLAILEGDSVLHEVSFYPTDPDPTVNQAEVTINDLRIRLEPSTSSSIMGYCPEGYYTITDTAEAEDMIWFKVCGYYIACVDGVRYIPAEDDPQKEIEELKAEIVRLNEVIAEKDEEIETQAEIVRKDVSVFTEIERLAASMIPE